MHWQRAPSRIQNHHECITTTFQEAPLAFAGHTVTHDPTPPRICVINSGATVNDTELLHVHVHRGAWLHFTILPAHCHCTTLGCQSPWPQQWHCHSLASSNDTFAVRQNSTFSNSFSHGGCHQLKSMNNDRADAFGQVQKQRWSSMHSLWRHSECWHSDLECMFVCGCFAFWHNPHMNEGCEGGHQD